MATKTKKKRQTETDSAYFLKLVMYFVFGSLWVFVSTANSSVPLPLGFLIGMAFASHEHFQIDRKIEYAILLIATIFAYFFGPRFTILL